MNSRTVLEVGGADRVRFLDRLVTTRMPEPGSARFAALLTPQGKILFDFFLINTGQSFLIDIGRDIGDDFLKRLVFYRLRSDVTLEKREDTHVMIADDGAIPVEVVIGYPDPREVALGYRAVAEGTAGKDSTSPVFYLKQRMAHCVPEGGTDYAYGSAFPHDAGFDQLGGIDFDKGCFVGQEVVSRMQHRGTARKRPVSIHADGPLEPGAELLAGDKPLSTVTSAAGPRGLCILRVDRAAEAVAAGLPLTVSGAAVTLCRPRWAWYDWPEVLNTPRNGEAA